MDDIKSNLKPKTSNHCTDNTQIGTLTNNPGAEFFSRCHASSLVVTRCDTNYRNLMFTNWLAAGIEIGF